jgi:hypothetical protein
VTEGVTDTNDEEAEPRSVTWLSDYVYGTIATLIAVASLTFETKPEALRTEGVVVAGAIAIWLAHALSRLVTKRAWHQLELTRADIRAELRNSWSILFAAVPAMIVFLLAGLRVWSVTTAFVITDVLGIASLAVVGIGTAGGADRPLGRRVFYVCALVGVGMAIVGLEGAVHLL